MQLLRLADVDITPRDQLFLYSRVNALLIALVAIAGSAALLVRASQKHWIAGYYLAAVILLFLALMHKFITARFRPSNWLVRMTDLGLYIKFRSYLNYHLPADDRTVVFIPFQEIRSARLVRERARVPDAEGRTATQILRYVELELAGDISGLENAIQDELGERAPTEKRWFGSSSTLYQDYPVRVPSPPFLRMRWQVVPRAQKFLDALRRNVAIADSVSTTEDFSHLQTLTREEQQKRLRELAERGESIAAIYMARKLYGCGIKEAQTMIDGLKKQTIAEA
jgi:hypothetical protein